MKIMAVNGSPRKKHNTAILLQHVLDGAASQGYETELVHLYDLNFKGCTSCLSCKLKGGKSYGKCAMRDDLTPILSRIEELDAVVFGSPNYIGAPTGAMKAFLERLIYPYIVYDLNWSSLFKKKIPSAFIYTMSSTELWMKQMGYENAVTFIENILKLFFGTAELLIVNDTSLFDDYSKYVSDRFDPVEKARIKAEKFPIDCQKAFNIGVELVRKRERT